MAQPRLGPRFYQWLTVCWALTMCQKFILQSKKLGLKEVSRSVTQLLRVRAEIQARWCLIQKLKHFFSALDGLPDQGPHALQGSHRVSGTAHLGLLTSFSGRRGMAWPLAGWSKQEWLCPYPWRTVTQLLKVGDETLRSDPWESLSGTPLTDPHPRSAHQQTAGLHVTLWGEGAASRKLQHHLLISSCSTPSRALEPVCAQTQKSPASFYQPDCHSKKRLPRTTDFSEETTKRGQVVSHWRASPIASSPDSRWPSQTPRGREMLAQNREIFWNAIVLSELLDILFQ